MFILLHKTKALFVLICPFNNESRLAKVKIVSEASLPHEAK